VPRADHLSWLHQGGRASRWGNLGLWRGGAGEDFAGASARLARAVGEAAGIKTGDTVLSLACGAGEELALWAEAFGAATVMGLELTPSLAAQARQRAEAIHTGCHIEVFCADVRRLGAQVGGRFERIVCVDAMYHLGPRAPLWRAARSLLAPGGGFAFTDLVLEDRTAAGAASAAWRRSALRLGAGLTGVEFGEVRSRDAGLAQLREAGFDDVRALRLDAPVLDGFCAFAARQGERIGRSARWSAGWRRVALTAWLIRTGRAAGLGYVLYSGRAGAPTAAMALDPLAAPSIASTAPARSPAAPVAPAASPAASTAAATASAASSAERTALSSSGMPGCA
jgi:SAM-dependent methyltransferase